MGSILSRKEPSDKPGTIQRILLVALREFDASRESEFRTLREYHPFLRDEDAEVSISELSHKLGLEVADRS